MELTTIKAPQITLDKINAPIPSKLIKQKKTGQKKNGKEVMLDYISGSTVIDLLNATFGTFGWSFEILEQWKEESTAFFQKDNDYKKAPDKVASENALGERGMLLPQGPVAFAKGRLTVKMFDEKTSSYVEVIKESFGSKSVIGKQSEQESTYKAAQTDALKKAASLLGIGAELYRDEDEQEAFLELIAEPLELVWTDELKTKYEEQWTIINCLCARNEWALSDLSYYVHATTQGYADDINYMPEEYMDVLIEMFKAEELVEA